MKGRHVCSAAQCEIVERQQWKPVENGGDTLRQAWDGGAWQACFERAASDLLNEHGLLGTDLSGPCAGVPKTVVHVAALRSLPGCGEQPRHADFARQLAYR